MKINLLLISYKGIFLKIYILKIFLKNAVFFPKYFFQKKIYMKSRILLILLIKNYRNI